MKKYANKTLTEEIAGTLRSRILLGEYKIGEKLNESKIAAELMVSRTPVREAVKHLESEGLVECIPNHGCHALGFSDEDIEDIYSVRAVVEGLAVRWAAKNISDEELSELSDICKGMGVHTARKNSRKVLELNHRFHELIYQASRSRFLMQTLRSYQEFVEEHRKITVYRKENLADILKEHMEIYLALKRHDSEKAEAEILRHLHYSRERFRRAKPEE